MNEVKLTKEADYLLCCLYKGYLEKRKADTFREKAVRLGSCETIQAEYVPTWPTNDILDAVRELSRAGLVCYKPGDNTIKAGFLTTDAIIYMEGRFGRNLEKLHQAITSLIPFLM